eukprot:1558647-Pleurochrysis_carterae.AAC.2
MKFAAKKEGAGNARYKSVPPNKCSGEYRVAATECKRTLFCRAVKPFSSEAAGQPNMRRLVVRQPGTMQEKTGCTHTRNHGKSRQLYIQPNELRSSGQSTCIWPRGANKKMSVIARDASQTTEISKCPESLPAKAANSQK